MAKINTEVLTKTSIKQYDIDVYQCDTVDPWEDQLLNVHNIKILVWGSSRVKEYFLEVKGLDAYLDHLCDIAKQSLHNRIDRLAEKIRGIDVNGKLMDMIIRYSK